MSEDKQMPQNDQPSLETLDYKTRELIHILSRGARR